MFGHEQGESENVKLNTFHFHGSGVKSMGEIPEVGGGARLVCYCNINWPILTNKFTNTDFQSRKEETRDAE